MLVEKISQTGNKMDRISQYTKYLNNGKEDVVIEEEEILKPSEIKILVLTSATDSEEPTINRLEKVCKKRSIELHRISSDKAYASKKSDSKETLIIYNYDGEGNSMEVNSNDNIVCIARRTVVTNRNAGILHKMLSDHGVFCINSPSSVRTASNKFNAYINFINNDIKTPRTCLVSDVKYIDDALKEVGGKFPVILKFTEGHGGKGVMKLDSRDSLVSVIQALRSDEENKKELILQEYKEVKDDRRILVLNGKVIAAAKRKKMKRDFRSNVSLGAEVEPYKPTEEEIEIAVKTAKSVDCYYCGVDIIEYKDEYFVLEVNPSPGSKSSYWDLEKKKNINGTELIAKLVDGIMDKDDWKHETKEVGVLEVVEVLEKGIEPMTAKMDTGNGAFNSIGAENIKVKGDTVEFNIKGHKNKLKKKLLPKMDIIKNNGDESEKRYCVSFDIKVGEKVYRDVYFSLSDRSNMNHTILISRKFMIDSKMSVNPKKKFVLGEL